MWACWQWIVGTKKRALTGTYHPKLKRLMSCAMRTIILQRENLNYLIVCITQCTLFFQHVFFLLPICLPCVICRKLMWWNIATGDNGLNVHKKHMLARQNRSLRQSHCVLIAKLHVHCSTEGWFGGLRQSLNFYRNSCIEFGQINFFAISVHS